MSNGDGEALELIEEILARYWRANPVWATFAGVRNFDGELPDISPEAQRSWRQARRESIGRIEALTASPDRLSRDALLELDFLKSHLEMELLLEEKTRPFERNPCLAPEASLYGLYVLRLRPFAEEAERAEKVRQRLEAVPSLLQQARRQLAEPEEIPPVWVSVARELVRGGEAFIASAVEAFSDGSRKLEQAARQARNALEGFGRFLDELAQKARGDFSLGEELFNYLCRSYHRLDYDAEGLLALGKKAVEETLEALAQEASRMEPPSSWEDVAKRLSSETVEPEGVLPLYRDLMARARRFVEERGLATIPEGERLEIVPTPSFARCLIPYAAYIPPGAFEADQTGYFWVTTSEEANAEARREGHCRHKAQITALHEAYPGHHLQFVRANRLMWPVRKAFSSTVLVEGWALYCEEFMGEEGFYREPEARIMQLLGQLWRACRVVIDASLHMGRMSPKEAVDMLVDVAKLARSNAEAEVRRYTLSPTQPMSYLVGKLEILSLRDALRRRLGDSFSLKAFHDELLSFGGLPLPVIASCMLDKAKAETS